MHGNVFKIRRYELRDTNCFRRGKIHTHIEIVWRWKEIRSLRMACCSNYQAHHRQINIVSSEGHLCARTMNLRRVALVKSDWLPVWLVTG